MRAFVIAAAATAACGNPPLSLTIVIDDSPTPGCGTSSCEDISLACDPYVSIRILDPDQSKSPYVHICQPLLLNAQHDLCSIYNVQLPSNVQVPSQSLEVQVVVFPKSQLALDMDTGDPLCPTTVEFAAVTGFPVETIAPPDQPGNQPAIGGRAFWHPGDAETIVRLGCSDLPLVTADTCDGKVTTKVDASAVDFDNPRASVSSTIASNLLLAVGEPQPMVTGYVFDNTKSQPMTRLPGDPPSWHADVHDLEFNSTACVQIIDEQTAETTPTLTCQPTTTGSPVVSTAARLTKASLDQILTAIGKSAFPAEGLVVGLVLDPNLQPQAGVTVTASDGSAHIQYLNATRTGLVTGATSSSGVFVSQDAGYTTTFSATDGTNQATPVPGGLVTGKVTIVMLKLD